MLNYGVSNGFDVTALVVEEEVHVKVIVKLKCTEVPDVARSGSCKGATFVASGLLVCKGTSFILRGYATIFSGAWCEMDVATAAAFDFQDDGGAVKTSGGVSGQQSVSSAQTPEIPAPSTKKNSAGKNGSGKGNTTSKRRSGSGSEAEAVIPFQPVTYSFCSFSCLAKN